MQWQDILQRRIPPIVMWALAILALTAAGQWLQSQVYLNHDVSWFVHFSRWMLQGRALGTDLHNSSLPMVWGLFMPPAALVQLTLLEEPSAVRVVFWAYFLISTALSINVLSRLDSRDHPASVGWVVAFVLIATLGPGFSFGQREHASILFAMPYLAAAVLRLNGGSRLRTPIAICIGVLAGIGFALKPYFLAVPALIELLLLARLGWRSLFVRVESLALGCTVLAYVVASGVLLSDYLKFTIDLTLATYWAYDTSNPAGLFARYVHVAQPAFFAAAIALLTRTWSWQHTVMLLAGLGYSVSYFVQSKGFVYHAYPVLVCSLTFLGICIGRGLPRAWIEWRASRSLVRFAVVCAVLVLGLPPIKQAHDDVMRWYFTYNVEYGPIGLFRRAVVEVVDHFAPTRQSYYYAFSTHPFPAFPTASYTLADYAGRSINQQFIAAYARLDEVTDPELRERVLVAADYQRQMVVDDFTLRPPSVVFAEGNGPRLGLNGRQFDDIAFYLADPRFRRIWANYQEYPPLGPLRVFVLRSADPNRPDGTTGGQAAGDAEQTP